MSTIYDKKVHSFFYAQMSAVFNFGEFKSRKCSISFSRDYWRKGQKNKKTLKIKAFCGYIFFYSPFLVEVVRVELTSYAAAKKLSTYLVYLLFLRSATRLNTLCVPQEAK